MKIKYIQRLVLVCSFAILIIPLLAQDAYAIFDKITQAYQGDKVLSYEIQYHYFDGLDSSLPSDSLRFKMVQNSHQSYMTTQGYTIVQDDKQYLNISDDEQAIYLQQESSSASFDLSKWKEMAQQMGLQLKAYDIDDQLGGLAFVAPDASDTRIEMVYDKKSYLLQSSSIKIDVSQPAQPIRFNQNRFEAKYLNYKYLKNFAYPISRFVKKQKDQWIGIGQYKAYQVHVF